MTDELNSTDESVLIASLMEYTGEKYIPWGAAFNEKISECYRFKELDQWSETDKANLALDSVPYIPIDKTNRALDMANGISDSTGADVKVVKFGVGDERIAEVLDKVRSHVYVEMQSRAYRDKSREDMLDVGIGIRKVLFDKTKIVVTTCDPESVRWSKTNSRTLKDVRWIWEHSTVDWADAMMLSPENASKLYTLRSTLSPDWEKIKNKGTTGLDYSHGIGEGAYSYPEQVHLWEFWVNRRIPYRMISSLEMQDAVNEMGMMVSQPTPKVQKVNIEYVLQEGEQDNGVGVDSFYEQIIVACGEDKKQPFILFRSQDTDHPYVGMCASTTKSGRPRGLIEMIIPHQKRKNIAWAQKTAWNNKTIKAAIMLEGAVGMGELDNMIERTKIGQIFKVPLNTKVHFPNPPQLNLQSIEEGESADRDMEFAVSSVEPVMRGQTSAGDSGIKVSKLQEAAMIPQNKWVKAENLSEYDFCKKVLRLILKFYPIEMMARIVGEEYFWDTMGYAPSPMGLAPKPPMMGEEPKKPVPLPIEPSVLEYDAKIEEKAVSDFKKQQSFNALMAMHQSGVLFDDEGIINSAPVEDKEELIASNRRKRNDVIAQLSIQVMQLEQMLGMAQKAMSKVNGGKPNQQGQRGKAQVQVGMQSMLGGTRPGGT